MSDYETKLFAALDAMQEGETKDLKFESPGQKKRFIDALRKYSARDMFAGIVLNTDETRMKRKPLTLVVMQFLDNMRPESTISLNRIAQGEKLNQITEYTQMYCASWPEAGVEFIDTNVIRKVDLDFTELLSANAQKRLFEDLMARKKPIPKPIAVTEPPVPVQAKKREVVRQTNINY